MKSSPLFVMAVLVQFILQPATALERQEETAFFFVLFGAAADGEFQFLIAHLDAVFGRPAADAGNDAKRVTDIHQQYTGVQAEEKRIDVVGADPLHGGEDKRMHEEIIQRTTSPPEEGEQRADNALDIAPAVGIVPQFHFHALDEDQAGDVFQGGHGNGNQHNDEHRAPYGRRNKTVISRTDQVQDKDTETVQRQVRPDEKAGVNPRMMHDAAVNEFGKPAEGGTDDIDHTQADECFHGQDARQWTAGFPFLQTL